MNIKTLEQIGKIEGKKVLLRVDYNTPLNKNGEIVDDARIRSTLDTISTLQDLGAKIIIISHLGRPKGQVIEKLKLNKVAEKLEELSNTKVKKLDESIGSQVEKEIAKMQNGEIIMLENIRFHKEEKECDEQFSQALASLGDIFVNDAFGAAHRKHSSTHGIAQQLPAFAGKLMEREVKALSPLVNGKPEAPLTMVFGGAKIATKIELIKNFIDKADYFLIGGALANTFLAAAGYNVADSLYEKDKVEVAREIMLECEKHKERFIIPHDVVVASEISNEAQTLDIPVEDVIGDMKILDIGKWTAEKFNNIIAQSKTVIWNGPLGLTEFKPFQNGTRVVAQTLSETECTSIIGGGDTMEAIKSLGIAEDKFSHISTGGGACIEYLSGQELPGLSALS